MWVCVWLPGVLTRSWVGLRTKIDDEGVWRIRRRAKDAQIEVFKTSEATGHGRVLTEEFINHRIKMSLPKMPDAAPEREFEEAADTG